MNTATLTHRGRRVRLYCRPCLFGGWVVFTASLLDDHVCILRETFATNREAVGWFLHLCKMFHEET